MKEQNNVNRQNSDGDRYTEKRLARIREKLDENKIDAILITKRENYIYLSGFTGTSAHLVITKKDAVLVTDFRYVEQASSQAPLFQIVRYKGDIALEINNLLKSFGVSKLGFEAADVKYNKYVEFKEKFQTIELVPLNDIVESIRIIKDNRELGYIKKAVEIADEAFNHILSYIKPGVGETEIAAEMEYFMKRQGGEGPSFQTIVASGVRSAMPHGVASEKELEYGDVIVMDYGAIYNGYCSDITRTVFLGDADSKIKKVYEIVLQAQIEALNGAFKGKTGREIDEIAREVITRSGYGDNFGHGLGHGVGLEIHEEPRFAPAGDKIMENGMVVTVEPGIYIEGFGGVRIEDMIVINDDEPLILTKASKKLTIV
ncbi:MAG TPA: Xaa-Pro peptidase family protein [Clostridiales bacterium]|nr:Xaa-Pro peptidase family protein [Clostridiales bacterium]